MADSRAIRLAVPTDRLVDESAWASVARVILAEPAS